MRFSKIFLAFYGLSSALKLRKLFIASSRFYLSATNSLFRRGCEQ